MNNQQLKAAKNALSFEFNWYSINQSRQTDLRDWSTCTLKDGSIEVRHRHIYLAIYRNGKPVKRTLFGGYGATDQQLPVNPLNEFIGKRIRIVRNEVPFTIEILTTTEPNAKLENGGATVLVFDGGATPNKTALCCSGISDIKICGDQKREFENAN